MTIVQLPNMEVCFRKGWAHINPPPSAPSKPSKPPRKTRIRLQPNPEFGLTKRGQPRKYRQHRLTSNGYSKIYRARMYEQNLTARGTKPKKPTGRRRSLEISHLIRS